MPPHKVGFGRHDSVKDSDIGRLSWVLWVVTGELQASLKVENLLCGPCTRKEDQRHMTLGFGDIGREHKPRDAGGYRS